jgi:hypothetical protein
VHGPADPDVISESPLGTERSTQAPRESLFVRLWALANINHILIQWAGEMGPVTAFNLLIAVAVLFAPASALALSLLAIVQVVDTIVLMPDTPDHQYLAALINLAFLVAHARRRPRASSALVSMTASTARWVLLIAYSSAVIAKYNSDFLDIARSCANVIGHTASLGSTSTDGLAARGFVTGTIAGETLVALLLLLPRARAWGVAFAIFFHAMLSASPAVSVGDFTTTLWAIFLLFLSTRDRAALGARMEDEWGRTSIARPLAKLPRPWAGAAALAAVALIAMSDLAGAVTVWVFTVLFAPWLLYHLVATLRTRSDPQVARIGRPPLSQTCSVILVVILAASPYVGLGTSSRFTMFSSLRTEGPGTNHLFMPSFHLVQSQNDYLLVERVYGPSSALKQAMESRAAIPTIEVRRILADESSGGMFVSPSGERIEVLVDVDHELRDQAPWWQRKTQHYRTYRIDGVTADGFCSN